MAYVKIGIIVNTHGIQGEIKIKHFTDDVERFEELDYLYIATDAGMKRFEIEGVRYAKSLPLLKLENLNSIDDAENYKGRDVYIDSSQLRELPEGTYHVFDLVGMSVVENGKVIGEMVDVNQNAYQDLYLVKTSNGQIIQIPAVKAFVKSIDIENGIIKVELIEGMLE